MICDLTGMDVSNASVYDGAEAAAEAVAMCRERKRSKALISALMHPDTISTIKTYCHGNGMQVEIIPEKDGVTDVEALKAKADAESAVVFIQHPNFYGNLEDAEKIGEIAHEAGAKFAMSVNPISLGILKTPREYGADVAVGDGQPLGLPIAFGGPYLGFMASTDAMKRNLPGRIVGATEDHQGRTGYVLTLQAREQHIRREKASSNVCSNQALCALAVGVYLAAVGKEGLKEAASLSTSKAHYLAKELEKVGFKPQYKADFFNEFVTESDLSSKKALDALEKEGILGGYPLDDKRILWCCTEVNDKASMDRVVEILKEVK
jgi:probable glycine dehydrogenase [decarboxylating] subunit 1